jgi:hypothetical protein
MGLQEQGEVRLSYHFTGAGSMSSLTPHHEGRQNGMAGR